MTEGITATACALEQPRRDVLLRHHHQLGQNSGRRLQARFLSRVGDGREAEHASQQADCDPGKKTLRRGMSVHRLQSSRE
jgi:hypothetical protein